MMRLFIGWRTTISNNFLHKDLEYRLKTQAILPLGSGQLPPMFSLNHRSAFLHKDFKPVNDINQKVSLISWSNNTFKPHIL